MNGTRWSTLVAAAACLTFVALATPARAQRETEPQRPPQVVASKTPPPTVGGKKGKWGASLSGQRQLQRSRGNQSEGSKESGEPSTKRPRKGRTVTDRQAVAQRPFRLNIGVCGRVAPDGTSPGPARCQPFEPTQPVEPTIGATRERLPQPEDVTWESVLAETKTVLFPKLSVKVQPAERTLVNLDTIVYTDGSKVSTTQVTLLGFPVLVEATPMTYSWSFGDGAKLTTTTPGKPYPSKEITHKYLKRGDVSLTLTTSYAARFSVAGGAWQYIDGMVPITGPVTPLEVREAVPVLVEPGG